MIDKERRGEIVDRLVSYIFLLNIFAVFKITGKIFYLF